LQHGVSGALEGCLLRERKGRFNGIKKAYPFRRGVLTVKKKAFPLERENAFLGFSEKITLQV
jgi:hypothetical protein